MKTILVISSFVSAGRIGANAAAFCLQRLGYETVVLPTTLMGRHPGWGEPGGGTTDPFQLRDMWKAIQKQNIKFDAVLSGYMGHLEHVSLAEDIIKEIKTQNPQALILVDPVMGDKGALYISEARAQAIITRLIPLADIITPNVWELFYTIKSSPHHGGSSMEIARKMATETLITSAPDGEHIGAVLITAQSAHRISHAKFNTVPHGGGDSLAAIFLAHKLSGMSSVDAMEKSIASIFAIMSAANKEEAGELPLIKEQNALINAHIIKSRII